MTDDAPVRFAAVHADRTRDGVARMPAVTGSSSDSASGEDPAAPLLRRWQDAGDREALDELLRLEVQVLKERIRWRGGTYIDGVATASDIAQQTVVRLLDASDAPRFEHPGQLRAWLWTAAWRLLVDHTRRPGRGFASLDDPAKAVDRERLLISDTLSSVGRRERAVALELALNLLRDSEREILSLTYFEHLDGPAAAARLGIPAGAVKMRLTRARRSLAEKLESWSRFIG